VSTQPNLPEETSPETSQPAVAVYALTLRGHLSDQWADWFSGAAITQRDNGETVLTCRVSDQAALHGLLKRVRDLGMPLLSVVCVQPSQDGARGEA
jgi:hypothetical protein